MAQLPTPQGLLLRVVATTCGVSTNMTDRFEQELGGVPGTVTLGQIFAVPVTDLQEAMRGQAVGPLLPLFARGSLVQLLRAAASLVGLEAPDFGTRLRWTRCPRC